MQKKETGVALTPSLSKGLKERLQKKVDAEHEDEIFELLKQRNLHIKEVEMIDKQIKELSDVL